MIDTSAKKRIEQTRRFKPPPSNAAADFSAGSPSPSPAPAALGALNKPIKAADSPAQICILPHVPAWKGPSSLGVGGALRQTKLARPPSVQRENGGCLSSGFYLPAPGQKPAPAAGGLASRRLSRSRRHVTAHLSGLNALRSAWDSSTFLCLQSHIHTFFLHHSDKEFGEQNLPSFPQLVRNPQTNPSFFFQRCC